jgi:hypothetical protein
VEEDAILVIRKGVVYLLVPDDTAVGRRDVDHLQPEGMADQIVGEHGSALQPRVGPSVPVGVGNVQFRNGDGVDLVRRLGDGALHRLLVLVRENRRHGGGIRGLELGMVKNTVRQPSGYGVSSSAGGRVSRAKEAAHVAAAVTGDCDVKSGGGGGGDV